MKKILSCFVALFAAVSLYATDLNIYASGLKVTNTASLPSKTTIDYVLNAPATALNVLLYDGNTLVATIPVPAGNENANYSKGSHSNVAIDLAEVANGTYTWKMEASAAAHADLAEVLPASSDYYFYGPRGVAVDNCPESPYFGRVYVSNAYAGKTSSDPNCRDTYQGMYIFDATLAPLYGGACYNGNVSWTKHGVYPTSDGSNSDWGPYRIAVDEEGFVFICDNGVPNDTCTGVYMMDPAHPENNFVSVLGRAGTNNNFHRANSLAVTGSGNNRVLYLNDWTDSIVRYPVGNNFPYTAKGVAAVPNLAASKILNAQNSIARDNNGGFWVCQYRGQLDVNPQLAHFNVSGQLDCSIATGSNDALAVPRTRRGALGLSPSNEFVVIGGGGTIQVIRISDNGGVPELSSLGVTMPDDIGNNVDGLAIDYADNVYVVSATKELLRIFAIPKAENKCVTPAPSAQQIVVNNVEQLYEIGSNQEGGWAPNVGTMLQKVSGNVFKYEGYLPDNTHFGFVTELNSDWNYVNARRFGAVTNDHEIANGDTIIKNANSFQVSTGAYYTIILNLNTMKVSLASIPEKVELMASWNNWEPVMMTNDDGDLTCSVTVTMTPDKYDGIEGRTGGFKVRINDDSDWMGSIETIKRTMPTTTRVATLNDATMDHNCGLWADVPGEYTFTYTYASKEMYVIYPGSFKRSGASTNYQTLCVPFTANVTNAEVFTVGTNAVNGNYVTLTPCSAKGLSAGGSYIIKPDGSGNDVVISVPGGTTTPDPYVPATPITRLYGQLSATYTYVHDDNPSWTVYVLGDDNMFHLISTGASATISSTRAYLHVEGGTLAPEVRIIEQGNDATNIENLAGQEKAVKFIENGRILIMKDGVTYDAMGRIVR